MRVFIALVEITINILYTCFYHHILYGSPIIVSIWSIEVELLLIGPTSVSSNLKRTLLNLRFKYFEIRKRINQALHNDACNFIILQMPWILLMSAFAGAGLIANDMRTGGLLLYLSRPLTLGDYILGKVTILFASLSMVTLVPGLVLFFGARSLAPDVLGDASHLLLVPKIMAFALVLVLPTTGLVLVMSALARNARFAGLGFFFVFVGSTVAQAIAWRATRNPYSGLISIQASMRRVGEAIFAVKPSRMTAELPPEWAFVVLAALFLSCLFILKTRVRAVEIVK